MQDLPRFSTVFRDDTLIAAFGALGGLSKIDRVIQALGTANPMP
jgi:hypothetical protein